MAPDQRISNFLARNQTFAQDYTPAPLFKDLIANADPDKKFIVIVSCFDPRAKPQEYFGLQPGEAVILSNAGGRVGDDTIRSLVVLDSLSGLGAVIVANHTDCGLCNITDEEIRTRLKGKHPEQSEKIEGMKFGEVQDPRDSVKNDMRILEASPFMSKGVQILGYVFDITHGTVEEVKTV